MKNDPMNLDYVVLLEIRGGRMIVAKASQSGSSETGTDSYCQIPNYSFIRFICSECFQYRGINTIIAIPVRQTRSIERYSRGITSIYYYQQSELGKIRSNEHSLIFLIENGQSSRFFRESHDSSNVFFNLSVCNFSIAIRFSQNQTYDDY